MPSIDDDTDPIIKINLRPYLIKIQHIYYNKVHKNYKKFDEIKMFLNTVHIKMNFFTICIQKNKP